MTFIYSMLRFFYPLFFVFLLGCSSSPNELKVAEGMLDTSPDSALLVLQRIRSVNSLSDRDRAFYGLLYFQALDKANKPLAPDSLLNFSLDYYLREKNDENLAICYYYKGRLYKSVSQYESATKFYLMALDANREIENYELLGNVNSDLGDLCFLQQDYKQARLKYRNANCYYKNADLLVKVAYGLVNIGRTYFAQRNYRTANYFYNKAISQSEDSVMRGVAFQMIGVNCSQELKMDSAEFFLKKSLLFPYRGYTYSLTCFTLADIYYRQKRYDSAILLAERSLKYPANYYTRRECYRVLANTTYLQRRFDKMAYYMTCFQSCTDTLRKQESQTRTSVLEGIHQSSKVVNNTKKYLIASLALLPIVLFTGFLLVLRLRKRNKGDKEQLEKAEKQIDQKQSLLVDNLLKSINEVHSSYAKRLRNSTSLDRERISREIYAKSLCVDNWDEFKKLMNSVFSNIIDRMEIKYPSLSHKEITWCCLHLLDVPLADRMVVLDASADSLYKLKQRLAKKMGLGSAKEVDSALKILSREIE